MYYVLCYICMMHTTVVDLSNLYEPVLSLTKITAQRHRTGQKT